jgi:hypothetical protein
VKASYRPPLRSEIAEFVRILQVAASADVLYFRTEFAGSSLKVETVDLSGVGELSATGIGILVKVSDYREKFLVGDWRVSPATFHALVDGKPSFDFVPSWLEGGAL